MREQHVEQNQLQLAGFTTSLVRVSFVVPFVITPGDATAAKSRRILTKKARKSCMTGEVLGILMGEEHTEYAYMIL